MSSFKKTWSRNPLAESTRYEAISSLGEGTFGAVYHARNVDTGEEVAIKLISLGGRFYRKYVEREILNHRQLMHPHIVAFKEVFVTSKHLAIVMEYVGGGNLQTWVEKHRSLPEWQARCFFQQLILALHYSHKSLGIAHRDIKLGNILLNDKYQVPILKLCDFGYSKNSWQGSLPKTRVGTAAYISPEVARANVSTVQYDTEKADVWSSALHTIKALTDQHVDEALQLLSEASPGCKELLRDMLRIRPEERISLDGIMANQWYMQYLPDISNMVSRSASHLQSDEEILRVLEDAEKNSKHISDAVNANTEFDDEAAMQVADEILQDLDDEDATETNMRDDDTLIPT
eukprot:jgi/Picre1/35749/NNA_003209.t1